MIILVNIGKVPDYINDTIRQLRTFNKDEKIIFLGDNKHFCFDEYGVEFIRIDINKIEKYSSLKLLDNKNNIFNSFPTKDFWILTFARFYIIEEYLKTINSDVEFFFFENDILIYQSLSKIKNILKNLTGDIFVTTLDDQRVTTGLTYFKNKNIFKQLVSDMDDILHDKEKIKDIRENYSECCPSEMTFLRKVKKEKDYIKDFPLLPFSNNFNEFNMLFDPAPYGQFFGGDNKGRPYHQCGDNILKTYIGKEIINNNIKISLECDSEGFKRPFCWYDGKKIPICNLHIHSKELYKFLSK
jgi:hypothetical protein